MTVLYLLVDCRRKESNITSSGKRLSIQVTVLRRRFSIVEQPPLQIILSPSARASSREQVYVAIVVKQ